MYIFETLSSHVGCVFRKKIERKEWKLGCLIICFGLLSSHTTLKTEKEKA